jgi:hypothetical protein
MKKQAVLLMAAGLMSFASCTTETHESDMSQAQIDSAVNARVEEIRMEMMLQNDSLINALAQIKADSIIAAMKGGSSVTTKTTTTRTTTVKPKAPAVSSQSGSMSQNPGSVTNRPGATNQSGTKVTDRPGATNSDKPKSVSDRPGSH